jgi:COP9 signalosome complex subunit 1
MTVRALYHSRRLDRSKLCLGYTRIDRLQHIGSHSTYFAIDASRAAIAEAKQGKNVRLYLALVENFVQVAPDDPAASIDTTWAEDKTRKVQAEQDKLEHELKSYKNNLIKESIRVRTGAAAERQ